MTESDPASLKATQDMQLMVPGGPVFTHMSFAPAGDS